MNKLLLYFRALNQYLRTAKAQHDLLDYVKAIVLMMVVMALIRGLLGLLF
jgi:hypothetical protein